MGQMDPARAQFTTVSTLETTNSSGFEMDLAISRNAPRLEKICAPKSLEGLGDKEEQSTTSETRTMTMV